MHKIKSNLFIEFSSEIESNSAVSSSASSQESRIKLLEDLFAKSYIVES
jgi:hypothetical protein